MPACALPEKRQGGGSRQPAISARLSAHITLEAHADGTVLACFDGHSVGLGKFSAGAVKRAQELRTGLPLGSFASRRPRGRQGNRSVGPAIGPARSFGVPPRALQRQGPGRHRAAGSRLLAANAKARRCRNDRAVAVRLSATARQRDGAGIAARRRVVQNLRSEDRGRPRRAIDTAKNQPAAAAGRFSGDRASRLAGGLPDPLQARRRQRRQASGRPKATTTSFSGTFTIFCSTPTARKAGRPTRWAGFIPMPALISPPPAVRPSWPGKKIDLRKFSAAPDQSRRSPPCCVNVIRRETSTTGNRSRSPSCHDFSMAPRAFSRDGRAAPILTTAVLLSSTPRGRIRPAAVLTNSNSI